MNKNDGQFIAIFMAIAIPVGFWIGLEFLNQPGDATATNAPPTPASHTRTSGESREPAGILAQEQTAGSPPPMNVLTAAAPTQKPAGLYKCQHGGRTTYTDKPASECDRQSGVERLEAAPASAGVAPSKPYQQQLAELEQEQARTAATTPTQTEDTHNGDAEASRRQRCSTLDAQVKWLDDALRHPHSGPEGDYWNARRREVMDQRFHEHC